MFGFVFSETPVCFPIWFFFSMLIVGPWRLPLLLNFVSLRLGRILFERCNLYLCFLLSVLGLYFLTAVFEQWRYCIRVRYR